MRSYDEGQAQRPTFVFQNFLNFSDLLDLLDLLDLQTAWTWGSCQGADKADWKCRRFDWKLE